MTKFAIAATLAAFVSVPAFADYESLVSGNPDSGAGWRGSEIVGVHPAVGSSFDVYHGLAEGNPDLFQQREWTGDAGSLPDIYHDARGNPDLSY